MLAVASVLDETLEWSASRPLWQQDALRRIVGLGHVDEATIEAYTKACLGAEPDGLEALSTAHVRMNGAEKRPVAVMSIRGAENVNALADGEVLTFAATGLTIVYGDNASGKSGYARILKAVTRTRASEQVRNDIFREQSLVPKATIEYAVGDAPTSCDWVTGTEAPDSLSQLSFFDRACSEVYISRETEAAFRPFGLGLFDELVGVCERVRAELDRRSTEAGRRTPGLPAIDENTEAGRFLQGLSGVTSDQALEHATSFNTAHAKRLPSLEFAEEQIKRGKPEAEAQRLRLLAQRCERLQGTLQRLASTISQATWDNLVAQRDDLRAKTAAAQLAQAEAFSEALLKGVGDAAWRVLWDAARSYSAVAYPETDFPVVEDAVCLLCQQPVGDQAAARLRTFEDFVRDTTQQTARAAETAYTAATRELGGLVIADETTTNTLADLRAEDPRVADEIAAYLTDAGRTLDLLRSLQQPAETEEAPAFPEAPSERLAETVTILRDRADELVKGSEPEGETALLAELAELRARKTLASSRAAVTAERDRLRLVTNVNAARSHASTKAITQKGAELTEKALTEVLVDRFTRETDRLGLEHVTLRTVGGRRGVLRYRARFVGAAQEAPLPEVLSEGEQTALGLAGFLSEVWTDPSKSGVIFDDPVSSLDHGRRDKVASRLVALAAERQTIVFTHDIAFVLALKKHADLSSVEVTERSIERLSAKPGHCHDFHKFSAKLVKERLNELDRELETIRGDRDTLTDEQYRDATGRWYKLLRRTWERAIEETVVGGVLTRDDLQVHPKMVRTLVLFTAEDNRVLQHGYGRATELSEVHDESPLINSPAPSVEELAADLETLRDWHKRVASRTSLSEEKIYELAKAGQT
jgi:AAA domain